MPSNRNPVLLPDPVSAAALKLDEPPASQPADRRRSLSQRRVELGAKSILAVGHAPGHIWTDEDAALVTQQEIAGGTPWSPEALGSQGEYYSGGTFVGNLAEDWSAQASEIFPRPSSPEPLAKGAGLERVARLGSGLNPVALTLP